MTKALKGVQYLAALAVGAGVAVLTGHLVGVHGAILAAAFVGWVDGNVSASPQKRGAPGVAAGGMYRRFAQSWSKATTDGNGTLYFVAQVPSDAIVTDLLLANDALTGCTSVDAGLFKVDKGLLSLGGPSSTAADYYAGAATDATKPVGTPVDAGAIFMSAKDINAGITIASPYNAFGDNIAAQTVTSLGATTKGKLAIGMKVWQLLGFTDPKWKEDSYVIGLRLNTAGSAAGVIALWGGFIQG